MNYPRVNWHTTKSPCPDQFLAKPGIVRIYVRVLAGQCENQFPKGKLLEGFAQNARFSLEGNRMEKVIPETTASQFRVEPLCYVMHRHSAMLLVKVVVVWSFEVCFCCFSSCLFTHIFGCFMIVIHVISCHILYVFRSNDIYIVSYTIITTIHISFPIERSLPSPSPRPQMVELPCPDFADPHCAEAMALQSPWGRGRQRLWFFFGTVRLLL